ncbi:nucleotide-diphospho-sugar transferase [Tanacetum coccineum]
MIDVIISVESIRAISELFDNTVYGFFLGKMVAYPIVANYVRNTWGKYGLVKPMLNSYTRLFSFQFSSMDGLNAMLENGLWFIQNHPLILKKWNPNVDLLKEDVGNVPIWVKLHGVPVTAFSEDGLSGRSSYARAMIELQTDVELKYTIVVDMPKLAGDGFYTCNVRVEYEWKPPRCACCKIFGHIQEECPKNLGLGVAKNLKKPSQAPRGVPVGPKVGFKSAKEYRTISKKPTINISESTKEVSKSNPFEVLSLVDNDVDLGTNEGISNSDDKGTSNVSSSNTPIGEKIDKIERQICEGKLIFVDDDRNPLVPTGIVDSDSEVEVLFDETANLILSTSGKDGSDKGYGTNSLLEQWRDSYPDNDDYDPYDDDMYENHDMSEHL